MKLLISATALCFLMAVPTYAHQQEQQQQTQDKDKQKQDEKQKQQTEKQQQEDRARESDRAKQDKSRDERARQDKQTEDKQAERERQYQDRHQQDADRRQNDRSVRTERRTISQPEFREHFGREHHFRVGHADNRHFAYGGYNFEFVDAWPAGWGYDDDFYIDYIDGQYYLIDLAHPDMRIAVIIVD